MTHARKVTVMGLGLFGGGVAAVRYFVERGSEVVVTDMRSEDELSESIALVRDPNVTFRLGEHDERDFTDTDLVIANPAVRLDNRYLVAARNAGVPIDAEMNLFFRECPAPIIGVTGSNGKSTTAALIAHIIRESGRTCHLGGNIGWSLLPVVNEISADDLVVLEISSFQLEYLNLYRLSPHVAVVMNVQANHLDWHDSMENYASAKRHIVEHQNAEDFAILNADDEVVSAMSECTDAKVVCFSMVGHVREGVWLDGDSISCAIGGTETMVGGLDRMKLIGAHNRQNALAAAAACLCVDITPGAIEKNLASFEPLPHRLQTVAVIDGITYINDSIATNPNSVAAALDCFDGNVILIAGGSPKDIPYDPMLAPIVDKVKLLLLVGRTAGEIESAVRAMNAVKPEIIHAGTVERAVEIARKQAEHGDTVLLSPACASFDQFRNFAERGERFSEAACRGDA